MISKSMEGPLEVVHIGKSAIRSLVHLICTELPHVSLLDNSLLVLLESFPPESVVCGLPQTEYNLDQTQTVFVIFCDRWNGIKKLTRIFNSHFKTLTVFLPFVMISKVSRFVAFAFTRSQGYIHIWKEVHFYLITPSPLTGFNSVHLLR